jgi:hypothetical protein
MTKFPPREEAFRKWFGKEGEYWDEEFSTIRKEAFAAGWEAAAEYIRGKMVAEEGSEDVQDDSVDGGWRCSC